MKKLPILVIVFLFSLTSLTFAVSKKVDMGTANSCMRECVQALNPSSNDTHATDVSVDEFTLDCVNYCNPNLKEGACRLEEDDCCNVMYQDIDKDCEATVSCYTDSECSNGYVCYYRIECITSDYGIICSLSESGRCTDPNVELGWLSECNPINDMCSDTSEEGPLSCNYEPFSNMNICSRQQP